MKQLGVKAGWVPDVIPGIVLVVCVLVGFILYAPALGAYFVAEDLYSVDFGWREVLGEFSGQSVSVGFRPGTVLYFVINNFLWKRNPAGYRVTAVLMHCVIGWLTYLITVRVTRKQMTAALAAVLFVTAPVHTEAVVWLAASAGTVTSGLLCMIAAWLWVRRGHTLSLSTGVVVAILYLMALLVKEVAIPLPGLLVLLDCAAAGSMTCRSLGSSIKRLLSCWPLGIAFCAYPLLSFRAGSWSGAIQYGVHLEQSLGHLVTLWGLYARDLFQPISGFLQWLVGTQDWLWLGIALVLLHILRNARWASLWVLVALLPGVTAYAERLTYLSVVGFSIVFATAWFDVALWVAGWFAHEKWRRLPYAALVLLTLVLFLASARAVRRDIANWVEAGRLTWSIPRTAQSLLPSLSPESELYFLGLPDNVNGAYAYRFGIIPEVRYVYGIDDLAVYHVEDGVPGWKKIGLESIACESNVPRLFFMYDVVMDELRPVDAHEFGVRCLTD